MIVTVKLSVPKTIDREKLKFSLEVNDGFKVKSIKFPLKPGSGRKRGSLWELEFCKKLSAWWSNGEDIHIFKRAGSTHSIENGNIYGDVYAVKDSGYPFTDIFAIELKRVKDTRVESSSFLCGKSSMFNDFWVQAKRQARMGNKIPVLVVKIDRACVLVFNILDTLGIIRLDGDMIPFCTLDDLFNEVPSKIIVQHSKIVKEGEDI